MPGGQTAKLFSYLSIALFTFLLVSCNTGGKKENNGNATDTTQQQEKNPTVYAINPFKKFRILKANLNLIQYRKLSLVPGFDDLSDPSGMSLYYFPVTQLGAIGVPGKAEDTKDGDAAAFDTKGIILSNNELVLANYDWPNIDYLVLEPTRDASNPDNLGYNITAYRFGASETEPDIEVTLPPLARASKPSPPAPPALYKK